MQDLKTLNKEHWNNLNKDYSRVWQSQGKIELSKKELSFISKYLHKYNPAAILDIGVGNGRITENHILNSSEQVKIYGIDISEKMVDFCKHKFSNEPKVKEIQTCDVSAQDIPFDLKFDLVTSIRVLKYNENWAEILQKVYGKLNSEGVYIFSMPNNRSVSGLFFKATYSDKNIPVKHTNQQELKKALLDSGFNVIEMAAFSKLPDFLYNLSNATVWVKFLLLSEKVLEKIFGPRLFGRELFIAAVK